MRTQPCSYVSQCKCVLRIVYCLTGRSQFYLVAPSNETLIFVATSTIVSGTATGDRVGHIAGHTHGRDAELGGSLSFLGLSAQCVVLVLLPFTLQPLYCSFLECFFCSSALLLKSGFCLEELSNVHQSIHLSLSLELISS